MGQAADLPAGSGRGPDLRLRLAEAAVELWFRRPGSAPRARSLAARMVLAERLGLPEHMVRIGHDERGAPRLELAADAAAPSGGPEERDCEAWSISISHTGEWLAVALADGARVGVDIELRERRVRPGTIERLLGESELAEVSSLPQDERAGGLLRQWTIREACGKALGTGLAASLSLSRGDFDIRSWDPVPELIGAVATLRAR